MTEPKTDQAAFVQWVLIQEMCDIMCLRRWWRV